LKSSEYQSRIANLESQLSSTQASSSNLPGSASLLAKLRSLDEKKRRIEELEARFKAFHGLPPDIGASRREVQRAEGELGVLKRRRDELFERM